MERAHGDAYVRPILPSIRAASERPRKHRWAGKGQTVRLNPAPAEVLMLRQLVTSTTLFSHESWGRLLGRVNRVLCRLPRWLSAKQEQG
ncbi:MAG: hypothetical protein EBZ60_08335 [Betaproteobacteria bacterium]|nr:hypothetical protein [Betaproteobacteria bacterium]